MISELEAKDLFDDMEPQKPVHDDNVNHPSHYTSGKVECIDGIEAALPGLTGFEGFLVGNAIKYLWRWKHKGGVTDLKKAIFYIERLITEVEHDGKKEQ